MEAILSSGLTQPAERAKTNVNVERDIRLFIYISYSACAIYFPRYFDAIRKFTAHPRFAMTLIRSFANPSTQSRSLTHIVYVNTKFTEEDKTINKTLHSVFSELHARAHTRTRRFHNIKTRRSFVTENSYAFGFEPSDFKFNKSETVKRRQNKLKE